MRAVLTAATLALTITTAKAAQKPHPYPGDDWELNKSGVTEKQRVDDYVECFMSPSAPPMFDARAKITTNPKAIEAHRRFLLSCMGAKGYVLVPPSAK